MDARGEIAAAIQRNVQGRPRSRSSRNFEGAGNVQGVAIGLGGADTGSDPGAPVVTVYLAEPAGHDDVRSAVVDAMEVRSAGDMPMRFVTSGVIKALANTERVRPAPGGYSIGTYRSPFSGTLGCLARGRQEPRDECVLCLTNNHVIADSNDGEIGDCICQPGADDDGTCPDDQIATLENFVEIEFDGSANHVDCATGLCFSGAVRPEIGYQNGDEVSLFHISDQTTTAALGMFVGKSGRTTELTRGIVTGIHWSGSVDYGGFREAFFEEQVVITGLEDKSFSGPGDSGSCVWTWEHPRKPVGLLFSGTECITLANPMDTVLDRLDIDLYTRD